MIWGVHFYIYSFYHIFCEKFLAQFVWSYFLFLSEITVFFTVLIASNLTPTCTSTKLCPYMGTFFNEIIEKLLIRSRRTRWCRCNTRQLLQKLFLACWVRKIYIHVATTTFQKWKFVVNFNEISLKFNEISLKCR